MIKLTRKVLLVLLIAEIILSGISIKVSTTSATYDFENFYDFRNQYNAAPPAEKPTILSNYISWQETTGGGFPAIQNNTEVVFIYYDPSQTVDSCEITGDFLAWNEFPMYRLDPEVSFFYRRHFFEPTSRIDYFFVIDGEWQLDPRNPNQAPFDFEYSCSELAMPLFVQPTEIIFRPDIPHGTLTTLPAPWTNPKVQVYIPPNYDSEKSYPAIYTGDGSCYVSLMSAVNILDNLIADQRIEPVIAVFIDPIDFPDPLARYLWYKCNPDYLTFLDSLVEYIDENYATNPSPNARLHLGFSASGLVSAYVVLERPETFKLLASQSGAFWAGAEYGIMEKYANAPASLDFKTWFSVGTYENNNNRNTTMVEHTQEMAAICSEKWPTEEVYNPECHSMGAWRHILDEMLEYFFPCRRGCKSGGTSISLMVVLLPLPLITILLLRKRRRRQ